MLIRTFQHIQESGLRVSMLDEDNQLPDIATAEQQFIIPIIGQALYDALNEVLDILAMPAPGEDDPPNPEPDEYLLTLLPMVQKPLAAFAYMADLPSIHTRLTSSGIRQTTSEGMPTAYRWQYDEVKGYLEERAYLTLEVMLAYLYSNAADYTDYIDTALQDNRAAQMFTHGAQFAAYFQLKQPFRTFIYLQPLLAEVIQQYISPAIGDEFLAEVLSMAEPDSNTRKLQASLRYAAANLTIAKAVQKLPFRITPEGFTIINASGGGAQSTPAEVNVTGMQTGILQKSTQADGEQAMRRAIKYLQTLASADLWPTFFESDLYKGPEAYKPDTGNSTRKIFRM